MEQDIFRILKQVVGYIQKTDRSKKVIQAIFRNQIGQTQ